LTVKPYSESGSKKVQIEAMFDNIAPNYDLLNRVLTLGIDTRWRAKAIKELAALKPLTILDVATGTGDFALEAYKRLQPSKIVGIDISHEMLELGRKKISKKSLDDKIEMIKADSEDLPFEEDSFDAVTASFGVRNFENLEKGIKENYRVLKPGGKIVILEFTKPRAFPFKQLFNIYFRYVLPVIGKVKSKDPSAYKYLYESVQAFPDYDEFLKVMKNVGFKSCSWKSLSFGICAIYLGEK